MLSARPCRTGPGSDSMMVLGRASGTVVSPASGCPPTGPGPARSRHGSSHGPAPSESVVTVTRDSDSESPVSDGGSDAAAEWPRPTRLAHRWPEPKGRYSLLTHRKESKKVVVVVTGVTLKLLAWAGLESAGLGDSVEIASAGGRA